MSTKTQDGTRFSALLDAVHADPDQARVLCAELSSQDLKGECLSTGAEMLATSDVESAVALCGEIDADLWQDECFFIVADRSGDRDLCTQAGRYEEDCRMHAWTRALDKELARDALPGEIENHIVKLAATHGFPESDDRPWIALYRMVLSKMRPMDRSACLAIPDSNQQEVCHTTGLALFHDRLNYVRDRGLVDCEGGPPPVELHAVLDTELQAALATRMQEDLCP